MILTEAQLLELPVVPACTCYHSGLTGLYFLWDTDALLYIGKAIDVPYRVFTHRKSKQFTHATWIELPELNLKSREGEYVLHYRPPLNLTRLG